MSENTNECVIEWIPGRDYVGLTAQNAVQDLMNTVVVAVNTNVIVKKNIMCIQLIFRL